MSDANPPANANSLRTRLQEKLPEIIIEAIFLALAVLAAFAIDAWRVERQQQQDTVTAIASIRAELQENQASVKATLLGLQTSLLAIAPLVDAEQKPSENSMIKIKYPLAMLSTASWTMAQNNQSLAKLSHPQRTDLAKLYELQGWFNEGQRRAQQVITELAIHDSRDWPGVRQQLRRAKLEFEFLANIGEELLGEYALDVK